MDRLENMIREIEDEVRFTSREIGKDALDRRVMDAIRKVPRHKFVTPDLDRFAYDNRPLPIGQGQTISQPYIVALMTDLLAIRDTDVVLEVGTGSGYQTAILACLAKEVYSIDINASLQEQAGRLLRSLDFNNVHTSVGDGYYGLAEHAPYDAILVTAAAPFIPSALEEQLKNNARMVIPVGQPGFAQELFLVEKDAEGRLHNKSILGVSFVPLVQGYTGQNSREGKTVCDNNTSL